jgi:DNA repair ATPase RecN
MLNLDQVRLLENRVEKAVGKIQSLTAENAHLRSQLEPLQSRVNELEGLVRAFKDDQGRIEEGILNALDRLSSFEDSVFHQEKITSSITQTTESVLETAAVTMSAPVEIAAEPEPSFDLDESESEITDKKIAEPELDIAANWQDDSAAAKPSSPNGQMDIF